MFLDMKNFDNGCVPRGRGRGVRLNCFCWACKWSLIEAKNQNSFKFISLNHVFFLISSSLLNSL